MSLNVSVLPEGPGYLPRWQLLVATTAILNAFSNFRNPEAARLVYNAAPRGDSTFLVLVLEQHLAKLPSVSALQSRTFAIWTLTSGMVRAFAAYNTSDPVYVLLRSLVQYHPLTELRHSVYKMTFLTYAFAFLHFASECFVYRTAKLSAGTISPFIVSCECHSFLGGYNAH